MSAGIITAHIERTVKAAPLLPSLRDLLSPQQFKAAGLVRDGLSNREIAEVLGIGESAIKKYLRDAFDRVGCESRVMLAVRYEREETAGRYGVS